jgi:chromosomal replication initiation ATPase DnaA
MTHCLPCTEHDLTYITIHENPEHIIDLCCEYFKIDKKDVIGKKRYREIMQARHMMMYLLYSDRYLNLPLREIGRLFSGRDHSSVTHAVYAIRNDISIYDDVNLKLSNLYLYVYDSLKYFYLSKNPLIL